MLSKKLHEWLFYTVILLNIAMQSSAKHSLSHLSFTMPGWDDRLGLYYLHLTVLLSTNTIHKIRMSMQ